MNEVLVVGAGGFAKEAAWLIDSTDGWRAAGFVGESAADTGRSHGRYNIVMTDDELMNIDHKVSIVIGIGNPAAISKISQKLKINPNIKFPNIIHPSVIADWERITLGEGNIVCGGNILTTDIRIGSFNIINLSCTIGHDSAIGDCNVINPGSNISGWVRIGGRTMIGTGTKILEKIEIGSDIIIGAGSVVTKNFSEPGVYAGVPARKIK
ncbi:MAG: acetyltransferase [Candidatus Kapaibacterium sp.]